MKLVTVMILLAIATCACGEKEKVKPDITFAEEAEEIWPGDTVSAGFKIPGEDFTPPTPTPPTEYGYDIKIATTHDGKFKVRYTSREPLYLAAASIDTSEVRGGDVYTYHVNKLGDIRPTPEAMDRAGFKRENPYLNVGFVDADYFHK